MRDTGIMRLWYAALALCAGASMALHPAALFSTEEDSVAATTPYDPPQDPANVKTATFAVG